MTFVDKYYEMLPDHEDLVFDGTLLRDGMTVLVGDERFRQDTTDTGLTERQKELARRFNRWATISHVHSDGDYVAFMAVYDDKTKKKIVVDIAWPWLVKLGDGHNLYINDVQPPEPYTTSVLEKIDNIEGNSPTRLFQVPDYSDDSSSLRQEHELR